MPERTVCFRLLLVQLIVLIFPLSVSHAQEKMTPQQLEFFEKKIRPVLVSECYSCHSKDAKSVKGGLMLDTREATRMGGDSGHAVVPGEIENSLLIDAIRYESMEMPPKEQLPESVIEDFEAWVKMGAPDPREGASMIKREINFEEAKNHWAYQPIRQPELPQVKQVNWPRSDIDYFVLEKLESSSLKPVGDADRLTLVRRLYYDLIGLPPTPDQLAEFLADPAPDAVEKLVDRLLASPQFGERWGRHWLDVVRYAESNGRERNFVYPNAWRYRDYVIESFNEDKPFDQFIREQVAGDLMEQPTNEQLVATGFLAIGPKLLNEGDKNAFQMDLVDEQIDITTRAFMGLTVSCARCHDHKFDPIPTTEYYSMAGIFRSTETLYGTKKQQGNRQASELVMLKTDAADEPSQQQQARQRMEETTAKLAAVKKRLASLQQESKTLAQKSKQNRDVNKIAEVRKAINNTKKRVQDLQKELKDVTENGTSDQAMGVRDGKVADSPVYIRGEVSSPKGTAPRGLLSILDPHLKQPILETDQSGRAELVDWIVSEQNPLTTRVLTNRVWHHLFGTGIVRTVDNFGATGEPPTHPELLDYLASRFRENGWSIKDLIREMVLSRAYQLSGDYVPANYEIDPDNTLLWRHSPQRVDAEILRDSMLLASGNLKLTPANGSPVANLDGEYGRQVRIDDMMKDNSNRSVYLPIIRNAVPEPLKLFDFAEPSILVGERPVTTVPTQALYFLNSKFVTEQCDRLAESLLANQEWDDATRIDRAYQRVLARPADGSEVERAKKFIEHISHRFSEDGKDPQLTTQLAWSGFVQALFGSAEFRYIE